MHYSIKLINKISLCVLLLWCSSWLSAQDFKVVLSWLPNHEELIIGQEQTVLNFDKAYYLSGDSGLPSILLTPSFDKIEITKTVYVLLTSDELALVDILRFDSTPTIHVLKGLAYKNPIVNSYVVPFRRNLNTGKIEKLISFSYKGKNYTPTKKNRREAFNGTTKSVLSEGEWFKLAIAGGANSTGSGMYKLDYIFLISIGFPVANVDPRKIKLFGNDGGMLLVANATSRPDDLMENTIYISGEEDGKFDPSDYILFYGRGPHEWKYKSLDKSFYHVKNIYAEESYYFLTHGDSNGSRVISKATNLTGGAEVSTYSDHVFYESDEFNLLESGREWFSKPIDNPMTFQYNTEGLVPNTMVELQTDVMAQAKVGTSFTFNVNGKSFNQDVAFYPYESTYADKGRQVFKTTDIPNVGSSLNINMSYNKSGNTSSRGFLNFIEAHFTRKIGLYGNQSVFNIAGLGASELKQIKISTPNPNATFVWDITSPYAIDAISTEATSNELTFSESISSLKQYVIFSGTSFASPVFSGKVVNQNLHGIDAPNLPDMVIITREDFLVSANQLKAFRKQHDNFDVEVVTTNQIYNEFSSGAQDLTAIRDYLKLLYKRGTSSDSLRYVLLLGASSFDYKSRIQNNANVVPIFESEESLHNVNSYCSEDYIGLLDDNEGDWENNGNGLNYLDVGIGRLPARNVTEAQVLINKIIDYHTHPQALGKWRNRISFVADDTSPPETGRSSHVENSQSAENTLQKVDKNLNLEKFYVNAYPQVSSPSGEVSPAIKEAFLRNIYKGSLMVNYSGHGSEFVWAQEDIININDINALKNKYLLPFFITATCEFGRYDDPNRFSGAQSLILNSEGGAIGLLCSTRPVYASSNTAMNMAFFRALFPPLSKKRQYPTMGEVFMNSKNNAQSGINNRNFALLCDPSLTLAFPKEEVVIKTINNKPFQESNKDTLKALGVVKIQGEIQKNGVLQSDFFGTVNLSFFDKTNRLITIDAAPNDPMPYDLRNSLVYDGSVSVDSGKFTFQFILPKDINYEMGSAKLSFYAQSKDGRDAGNADTTTQIGGSASNLAVDNTPPRIKLFMDDTTFASGGLTNSNTQLIAYLFDDNGINISSSSIGHEITGKLNNGKEVVVMNDFYTTENNSYKYGKVIYPFANLSEGSYKLTFKVWDTYNNSSSSTIEFIVAESEKLALKQVMNFPNPFAEKTNFKFNHNRAGETLEIKIEITDNLGRSLKTLTKTIPNSTTTINDLEWEGVDDSGAKLSAGSYIYKINVTSQKDKANAYEVHRLVMLN